MNGLRFAPMLVALLPSAAIAQAAVAGPYVALGGGIDLLQNEFEKPLQPGAPTARTYTFGPGAATDLSVGFGFGDGLRVEIEGDFASNHVHGVEAVGPERAGGLERQYGGLGNVFYDLSLPSRVHPYLGVGFGYQAIDLDGVNSSSYGEATEIEGSETHGSFAYQGIAGFAVPFPWLRGLSATLEYRLIGVTTPSAYERSRVSTVLVPTPLFLRSAGFGVQNGFGSVTAASPTPRLPPFVPDRVETVGRAAIENIFNHEILVGLRYAFGTPQGPAPAPALSAPASSPSVTDTYLIFFEWNRTDLTPRARQIVNAAAEAATRSRTTTIVVDGYADTSHLGSLARGDLTNLALSRRRADSVRAALVQDGTPVDAITVAAFGNTRLLVPTGPDTHEPQNRRVSIVLRQGQTLSENPASSP